MKFSLSPSSGHSNSYLDVAFSVELDSPAAEITLHNDSAGEQINVIAVSSGVLVSNKIIVNSNRVDGYIELFNSDKMNSKLENHEFINIRCVSHTDSGTTEASAVFYNLDKSADNSILPITVHIDDHNIKPNRDLLISVFCDKSKWIEMCLISEDRTQKFHFEVHANNGNIQINVPYAVMVHELQLEKHNNRKFDLYLVRHNDSGLNNKASRNYIALPDTSVNFVNIVFKPEPQNRLGPDKLLSDEFIISDRYLVHVPREHSGLNSLQRINPAKHKMLQSFIYESQNLQIAESLMANRPTDASSKAEVRRMKLLNTRKSEYASFLSAIIPSKHVNFTNAAPKAAPCGCGRK